jgi:1,4-alpha-glucan branching enzyme
MGIFNEAEGGLLQIAHSYKKFGMHVREDNSIEFIEWAPAALSLSLFGDFNNWNRE